MSLSSCPAPSPCGIRRVQERKNAVSVPLALSSRVLGAPLVHRRFKPQRRTADFGRLREVGNPIDQVVDALPIDTETRCDLVRREVTGDLHGATVTPSSSRTTARLRVVQLLNSQGLMRMPERQVEIASAAEISLADSRSDLHQLICTTKGCAELIRTKGLCAQHHQQRLAGTVLSEHDRIPRSGPCLVNGCDQPRRSRGLCARHYDCGRRRTECPACGGTMDARSGICVTCHLAALAAHLPTDKTCPQCERTLPVSAFNFRKSSQGIAKWRSRCRECEATNSRLRASNAHRDRSKERLTKPYLDLRGYAKKLGIPWAEVVERYPADNRCELCRRTPQEANPGGRFVRLSLDHCHETGRLRGFLCNPCNTGLGHLGDTAERLRAALKYLHRQVPAPRSSSRSAAPFPGQLGIPIEAAAGEA